MSEPIRTDLPPPTSRVGRRCGAPGGPKVVTMWQGERLVEHLPCVREEGHKDDYGHAAAQVFEGNTYWWRWE